MAFSENLADRIKRNGIFAVIDPSLDFESIPAQIELANKYPKYIRIVIGVSPAWCFKTRWENRKRLEKLLKEGSFAAVGEIGLDYCGSRIMQHRLIQKRWFSYQIELAGKLHLPLILHIKNADSDALKILKKHRDILHGGVVHCFNGDYETAQQYIQLGFAVGTSGQIFADDGRAEKLRDVVEQMSLTDIILDAPYLSLRNAGKELNRKQWLVIRNFSLVQPKIARKIAEIKGLSLDEVEKVTLQNVSQIFGK